MKKIMILLIMVSAIVAGCAGPKTEIQTEAGKVTVQEGAGIGPEWCKAGTTVTLAENQMTLVVKGLTTYKGKQVCEMEGKFTGAGIDPMYSTQYVTQDGSYIVTIIKDASGNVLSVSEN
ncbi:MAG: hypothetical protein Q7U60_10750 [Candidatus Methanoperedens sp.]|nr:hypothetical protein [Candidatus Methanoperedens sp.]